MVPNHIEPERAGAEDEQEIARALLMPLRAALRRVEDIPIASYEEREDREILQLLDDTRASIATAVEATTAMLDHYDAVAEARNSVWKIPTVALNGSPSALVGALDQSLEQDVGVRRIQNLAFIARMGLRGRETVLAAMSASPEEKWKIIDVAGSALRQVQKALGAIDVAVCEFANLPEPTTFYVTELERSLEIRRAYYVFHAEVAAVRELRNVDVSVLVRRASIAVAKLAGRPIYTSLRVHDRFMLRAVQRRMRVWLETPEEDAKARVLSGGRLHQDVANLAELMLGVNERAELRRHDGVLAANVAQDLEAGRLGIREAIERLKCIRGRDPDLDALTASPGEIAKEALTQLLTRLQELLTPRVPSAPAPRPTAEELDRGDDFF